MYGMPRDGRPYELSFRSGRKNVLIMEDIGEWVSMKEFKSCCEEFGAKLDKKWNEMTVVGRGIRKLNIGLKWPTSR